MLLLVVRHNHHVLLLLHEWVLAWQEGLVAQRVGKRIVRTVGRNHRRRVRKIEAQRRGARLPEGIAVRLLFKKRRAPTDVDGVKLEDKLRPALVRFTDEGWH